MTKYPMVNLAIEICICAFLAIVISWIPGNPFMS